MKKQHCLLLVVFAGLCFACKKPSPSKMIDLVHQRFEAMNKHDLKGIDTLYSDSALIESPNLNSPEKGRTGIHSVYSRYFVSSPDLIYTITRIIPGDSSVTVEFTSTGTMQHLEGGGPSYMLGKKYTLKNCAVLDIRNNKIVHETSYFDQVAFLRQVGFFDQH
jgi:steroid delta-isomerase-like uncharacterized protein